MTKFTEFFRQLILPAGFLASLIVGAGMFALPYVFSRAGFLVGFFYLAVFTVVSTILHLQYLEIIQDTPGRHRFVGYAQIYLGKMGFRISSLTTAFGLLLVLTVYLVLGVHFLEIILPGLGPQLSLYLFWLFGAGAVVASLKRLASLEFIATLLLAALVVLLFGLGLPQGQWSGLTKIQPEFFFLPYGAVLFSLAGRPAISSLVDYFEGRRLPLKRLRQAVILGSVLPAVIYLLFVLGVIWLSPAGPSPDALSGLDLTHYPYLLVLMGFLGLLAIWTSYFFLGLEAKDIFRYDFRWPSFWAGTAIVFSPLFFYLLGFNNFIQLVGLSGSIFLALESVMVVLMRGRISARTSWWGKGLIAVFILGALYEILKSL